MPENISPETAERIRALCRKISVAHNLDEEIQRELYAHMEDKLLGYLSGEEKVTEEDAFILMREHFGKPETVRGLFREVHAMEAHISLARKTGIVIAASLGCRIILFLMLSLYFLPLFNHISYPIPYWIKIGELIPIIVLEFGAVALFWRFLVYCREKQEGGIAHRLTSVSPSFFWAILLVLTAFLIPAYQSFATAISHSHFGPVQGEPVLLQYFQKFLFFLIVPFSEYLWPMVWFWWFDVSLRRFNMLLYSFGIWLLYSDLLETTLFHLTEGKIIDSVSRNILLSLQNDWKIGGIALGMFAFGTIFQGFFRNKIKNIAVH